MSHQHATAVIDVPVPIGQDLDATGARLLALAAALRDDAAVGSSVVDEPSYLGVQDLVEDRALLRIVITTQPSQQFVVRRAYLGRIAAAIRAGDLPPLPITGMQKEVVVREGASTDAVMGGLD
jgi:small conductance mechanosensitive channel